MKDGVGLGPRTFRFIALTLYLSTLDRVRPRSSLHGIQLLRYSLSYRCATFNMSKDEVNVNENTTVSEQLNTITSLLQSFDDRLKIVENAHKANISAATATADTALNTAEAGCINDGSTATGASATDINKEFEAIKDSVSKIVLPPYLKINDSPAGVKQEYRHALKLLSKSARFTETGLKLLSTFNKSGNCYNLTEDDINALFITLSASSHYLQAEYANIVVKSSFDEETSRLFSNLENNSATFNDKSLQNIRIAAELAAVSNKSNLRRPARNSYQHMGFRSNYSNWRGRFFQNRTTFPRQPYSGGGYNVNNSGGFSSNYNSGNFNPTNRD